jgi:hypothetical protein
MRVKFSLRGGGGVMTVIVPYNVASIGRMINEWQNSNDVGGSQYFLIEVFG